MCHPRAEKLGLDFTNVAEQSKGARFCYLRYGVFFAGLVARCRARRSAVRFFAAAIDAFFARAFRSAAVMFFAAILPPSLPYRLPKLWRYSSTSGGIRLAIL